MSYEKLQDLKELIDTVVDKINNLTPASFGKFTAPHLPDDYFYNRWKNNKKNFLDVWGNMDPTNKELFMGYCGIDEAERYLAVAHFNRFAQWAFNWDGDSYGFNAFDNSYNGKFLSRLATGKQNPQGISDYQVLKAYTKANEAWRIHMLKAAFYTKKKEESKV